MRPIDVVTRHKHPDGFHGTHGEGLIGARMDLTLITNGVEKGPRLMTAISIPARPARSLVVRSTIDSPVPNQITLSLPSPFWRRLGCGARYLRRFRQSCDNRFDLALSPRSSSISGFQAPMGRV
jgi:hypothetical protein